MLYILKVIGVLFQIHCKLSQTIKLGRLLIHLKKLSEKIIFSSRE